MSGAGTDPKGPSEWAMGRALATFGWAPNDDGPARTDPLIVKVAAALDAAVEECACIAESSPDEVEAAKAIRARGRHGCDSCSQGRSGAWCATAHLPQGDNHWGCAFWTPRARGGAS
jgi:hypothetical protein